MKVHELIKKYELELYDIYFLNHHGKRLCILFDKNIINMEVKHIEIEFGTMEAIITIYDEKECNQ